MDTSSLRVRVVARGHVDRGATFRAIGDDVAVVLERLVGEHWAAHPNDGSIERQGVWYQTLDAGDLAAYGSPPDLDALFRVAAAQSIPALESVNEIRIEGGCIYALHEEAEPFMSACMLDPARALEGFADVGPKGVLLAVPHERLVLAFVVGQGDLQDALEQMVHEVLRWYDPNRPDAVSRWLYWHDGTRLEEVGYDLDDLQELESVNLPNALLSELDTR